MQQVSIKIDEDSCTGCVLCVLACPTECLDFDEDRTLPVVIDATNCLVCHNCEDQCAFSAIDVSVA